MSRWIDAEYCEDFFDRWESRVKNAEPVTIDVVQNTRTLLRDAPTIDIVRCKNCIYYTPFDESRPFDCSIGVINAMPNDYCSKGERKDNE